MQFDLWKLTNEPGVRSDKKAGKKCVAQLFLQRGLAGPTVFLFYSVPTWAKPWRSLGQALGGNDPTSFLRRSRPPDHRGHDAHRSTGGPPTSSFFACILDSANRLQNGYGKKTVGWTSRQMQSRLRKSSAGCPDICNCMVTFREQTNHTHASINMPCHCLKTCLLVPALPTNYQAPTWAKPWSPPPQPPQPPP